MARTGLCPLQQPGFLVEIPGLPLFPFPEGRGVAGPLRLAWWQWGERQAQVSVGGSGGRGRPQWPQGAGMSFMPPSHVGFLLSPPSRSRRVLPPDQAPYSRGRPCPGIREGDLPSQGS